MTVSSRGIQEGIIELKRRDQEKSQKQMIAINEAIPVIQTEKTGLEEKIKGKIIMVPYKE